MSTRPETMREAEGFLFIGDPHLSSRKPGRRKDENFAQTVLGKIRFCIELANERRLVPTFLGDMFDTPVEPDETLKTQLIRILRASWTQPVSNVGNHDIRNAVLTDGDSLSVLAESGVIRVAARSGALETFLVGGKVIGLGATPYGQAAPTDARPLFGKVDSVIWLMHHDVAFENAYPGSMAPFPIAGCPLVVNGHMHLEKKAVRAARTLWVNPGNITRQHLDAMDHVPCVWALGASSKFEKVPVPHQKAAFDLTGRLIDAASPGQAAPDGAAEASQESAFVSLLRDEGSMDMAKSDDGSVLMEDVAEKFERESTPDAVRAIVRSLHAEAVGAA